LSREEESTNAFRVVLFFICVGLWICVGNGAEIDGQRFVPCRLEYFFSLRRRRRGKGELRGVGMGGIKCEEEAQYGDGDDVGD
jgi:hypothetical protein